MVKHDTFTVSVKKTPVQSAPVLSLITQERTQKLELLIHLLVNLPQSLVVCGPKGIGKTTLLNVLQERENQSWLFCPLQGNASLSFEAIEERLGQRLGLDKSQSLITAFSRYDAQHRKIILIIDDAGTLVPGLITTVIQFAAAHPVLRVIFVFTHDELHVQSKSDRVLDDCHVIEIPPLSEKQCGEFLQVLSSQSSGLGLHTDINEHLIESVYRETHGIPGRIIEHTPDLLAPQQGNPGKWWMAAAVVALVGIALAVQYSNPINTNDKALPAPEVKASEPAIVQPVAPISSALPSAQQVNIQPEPALPLTLDEPLVFEPLNPAEPMVTVTIEPQQTHQADDLDLDESPQPIASASSVTAKKVVEAVKPITPQAAPLAKKTSEVLVQQEKKPEIESPLPQSGDYTLQLIVLSKQTSIDEIQRKYPALSSGFRVVKTLAGGQERFALMYGSFDSAVAANKARQSLPTEFRNALVRKAGSR